MPLTVITLKKVPQSLKGDLTKWMQEIATGVYVGNFNSKIRSELWNRVKDSVKNGEATMCFSHNNEIGYNFDTINSQREVIEFDGIPLIMIPLENKKEILQNVSRYSNSSKFLKIKKSRKVRKFESLDSYVVVDIETDGLDIDKCSIIELGAVKKVNGELIEFSCLLNYSGILPEEISHLTGINTHVLKSEGIELNLALDKFVEFVGNNYIVGYGVDFDVSFINSKLSKLGKKQLKNKRYDLLKYVKKEKMFLDNYKLQTVLNSYDIYEKQPHRALGDAKLIYILSTKVNKFLKIIREELDK